MSIENSPRRNEQKPKTLIRLPDGGFIHLRPGQERGLVEGQRVPKKNELSLPAVPVEIFPHGKDEVAVYVEGTRYTGPVIRRTTNAGQEVNLIETNKEQKGKKPSFFGRQLPLEKIEERVHESILVERKAITPFKGVPSGGTKAGSHSSAEASAHFIFDESRRDAARIEAQKRNNLK